MKIIFIISFLCFSFLVFAHEGHQETINDSVQQGRPTSWIQWIGSFHLILLHFPIALINMLAISEVLGAWTKRQSFEFSSRFLIISAAVVAPPTALLGLIYSYSEPYEGIMATFLWWHMSLGIITATLAVISALLRARLGADNLYYACLALLFLLVNVTGFLGAGMTFGPYHMHFPL